MSQLAFEARRATGLSQRVFARMLDVHPGTVARWESGERVPTTTARTLLRLIYIQPRDCVVRLLAIRGEGRIGIPPV